MPTAERSERPVCEGCGTEIAANLVVCPGCRRLVHRQELERLAASAAEREGSGDLTAALGDWRQAMTLLPAGSKQHEVVLANVTRLSQVVEKLPKLGAAPGPTSGTVWAKVLAPLGVAGLVLWKLKFLVVAILTKGKLLLLGLTKGGTFLSMLLSIGVYGHAFGWPFALGLVLSIYVHEMGHVAALSRYGIKASAPMFIPGLGALVRLEQYPATPREDARVGLAGPLWGLGAAAACAAVFAATATPYWAAVAEWGARINLFNLVPVWQLDGSRGFRALSRAQRWLVVLVIAGAFVATHEGSLALVGIVALVRCFGEGATEPDWGTFSLYAFLVAALSSLCLLKAAVA